MNSARLRETHIFLHVQDAYIFFYIQDVLFIRFYVESIKQQYR